MAESSNSRNIEDVLSSIRRLVSEEVPPAGPAGAGATAEQPAPDKLVLTPQLRVTEPEDPYQTIRALDGGTLPREPMPSEPSLEDASDARVLMAESSASASDAEPFAQEADPKFAQIFGIAPGAVEAEREPPQAESETSDIPDVDEETEKSGAAVTDALDGAEERSDDAQEDSADIDAPFHAADLATGAGNDTGLEATRETRRGPTAEAIPFPQPKVVHEMRDTEENPLGDVAEADDVLDEETLREIIAEVVREELSGALGERITRNVRKLVRREIRQILTSEDFD